MTWIVTFTISLIAIYLIRHQIKKRRLAKLRGELKSNWGELKKEGHYNFNLIDQYFQNTPNKKEAFHIIDEQIKNDLDINDVFQILDRTSSKIGQQYLYYKLRVIEKKQNLQKFQELTDLMSNNESLRIESQIELSKLNAYATFDLEKLIHHQEIEKPIYQKFLLPLGLLSLTSIILGTIQPTYLFLLIPLFMVNMVFHYKTKSRISEYLSAISQLNKSFAVAKNLATKEKIRDHFEDLTFMKRLQDLQAKTKFISIEKRLDNEYAMIVWFIYEIIRITFNFESIIFFSFADELGKKRKRIDELFQFLGKIDSSIAIASFKFKNELICTPTFIDSKTVNIKGVIHPLIQDCAANDLALNNESMLLTGSNMSGKTTFIRSIALNCITSQTLNLAFANQFEIPFFKVFSSIRITDDVNDATSYYLQEVLTIKRLIEESSNQPPCLFVLDEIFKGTNTSERISGGKAILSYLNTTKDMVFVSTHDLELADLLEGEQYNLRHFSEEIRDNELYFDHKLKEGKLKTKNAIKILELYDYPLEIVNTARKTEIENFK